MSATATAANGSNFPLIQVGDILYGPNYWGTNTNPAVNPNTNGTWTVPCGALLNSDCYSLPEEGSAADTDQCTFCYTMDNPQKYIDQNGNIITEPVDNTFEVQAYPYYLLGSGDGGRDNTWGVPCGALNQLASTGRCNGTASLTHPVWDMRQSRDAVGLPQRLDLIGTLNHCFSVTKDCSGTASNVENVFFDTYLHRIDQPTLWPAGFQNAWSDVNKINSNATECYNINIKLCLPEFAQNNTNTSITTDPGAAATGGVRINNTPINVGGVDWSIYLKWENLGQTGNSRDPATGIPANGLCTNSFYYISFIPWDVGTGVNTQLCTDVNCIDFKALMDWVSSQEFKDRVLGNAPYAPIAANKQGSGNQANWPLWVYQNVGSPPFPVDSPSSFVLAGIQGGNEIWWSTNNTESCICWENLYFETDLGVFGKSEAIEQNCINCNTSTLPAQTFQTGTSHSFLINLQDTAGNPLTTAPTITPNTYINSVTNQGSGNFLVTVTVPTGQQGVYPLVINNGVAGCTNCQLILNAQQIVIPVCTTTTATATVRSVVSTPCSITFSNPTPKAGETITATACNCAGYTFSNWTSTPAGSVINGNTATYTVPFGAVAGSTEQFSAVCCEV